MNFSYTSTPYRIYTDLHRHTHTLSHLAMPRSPYDEYKAEISRIVNVYNDRKPGEMNHYERSMAVYNIMMRILTSEHWGTISKNKKFAKIVVEKISECLAGMQDHVGCLGMTSHIELLKRTANIAFPNKKTPF